jgi:hypothetical protein
MGETCKSGITEYYKSLDNNQDIALSLVETTYRKLDATYTDMAIKKLKKENNVLKLEKEFNTVEGMGMATLITALVLEVMVAVFICLQRNKWRKNKFREFKKRHIGEAEEIGTGTE